jgi:hypothetical protein
MAMTYAIKRFISEYMSLFKGDDSAINCRRSITSVTGHAFLSTTGHVIKNHTGPVGDFAGYILTPIGLFPDVVRFTCKFIGKTYRSQGHFDETKISTASRCAVVKNEYQKNFGCYATAQFYCKHNVNFTMCSILFDFLCNAGDIKYSDLQNVTMPVVST